MHMNMYTIIVLIICRQKAFLNHNNIDLSVFLHTENSSPNIANVNIYLIVGILVAFIFTITTCFGAVTVYTFVSKRIKR